MDANIEAVSPATMCGDGRYACHRCWSSFKHSKDMIRHVEESCEAVKRYQCSDCPSWFKRAERFRKHHLKDHQCSAAQCTHAEQALVQLLQSSALGCGFCERGHCQPITEPADLRIFLKHMIAHYEMGAARTDWSVTRQVKSLLMQPYVLVIWYELCSRRFGSNCERWPNLVWTFNDATEVIAKLEHTVAKDELRLCLPNLLDAGLSHGAVTEYAAHGAANGHLSLPSDINEASEGTLFAPMLTGFGIDSSEDAQYEMTDFRMSSLHDTDSYRAGSYATTLVGMEERLGFITTPEVVPFSHDMEYDDMGGPGNSYPSLARIYRSRSCESSPSLTDSASFQHSETHDVIPETPQAYPPHNPTPPVRYGRSHKRSVSGSIWRMLQTLS